MQLVPQVLRRAGLPRQKLAELLALTYFMAAARFEPDLLCSFRRDATMLESAAYKEVVAEGRTIGRAEGEASGRLETLRAKLIKLVRHRLGRLPRGLPGKLKGISADRLDALFDRALETEDPRALRALLAALPSPRR